MKKSLVLAMAMALGVTASAYAANPFSDVPAGHWAYDSISKLAAAGVIEGYGDDTFRGDRLMTRYEMAQIVAKAMAKGANVDKLAAEFADELDALGVRVAALEKKSDNVKITGQIRWRYRQETNNNKRRTHDLRTRLTFTGKVNDNWNYVGMVENVQNFENNVGDETTNFQRAYLQGRLGGAKVTAGRYHEELVGGDSDVYSNRIDGIKAEYGDKVKLMGYFGKLTALGAEEATVLKYNKDEDKYEEVKTAGTKPTAWGAHLDFALGKKFNLFLGYDELKVKDYITGEMDASGKIKLFDIGAKAKLGDVNLTAIYLHGKQDEDFFGDTKKNGFTVEAAYKGAVASKPGSWGLSAKYYNQGGATYWSHGSNGPLAFAAGDADGFKGFRVSGNYTFAKNMVYTMSYYDLKGKDNGGKVKTWYNQLIFTF